MSAAPAWSGVFPAAVTHFVGGDGKNRNDLDLPATAKHLRAMLDAGIDGLVMLGTVGENPALDADEKLAVLKCGIEAAKAHAADTGRRRRPGAGRRRREHDRPRGTHSPRTPPPPGPTG